MNEDATSVQAKASTKAMDDTIVRGVIIYQQWGHERNSWGI